MTKEAGLQLGSKVGKVKDIDTGASGDCMGKFLRIRVSIDISKPLKRGIRVSLDDSEETIMLLIRYERLPEYCFGCGMVGHHVRDCPSAPTVVDFVQADNHPFGPWLRASSSGMYRPARGPRAPAGPVNSVGNTGQRTNSDGEQGDTAGARTNSAMQTGLEAGTTMSLSQEGQQVHAMGTGEAATRAPAGGERDSNLHDPAVACRAAATGDVPAASAGVVPAVSAMGAEKGVGAAGETVGNGAAGSVREDAVHRVARRGMVGGGDVVVITASILRSPGWVRLSVIRLWRIIGEIYLLFFRASPIDCSAVGSILDIYSRASGQVINFDKYALCASKQVAPGFLWGLNIPAKVRMFVWRACRNLLPTRSLLAARRVPVGAGCPLCDAAVESVLHSLWLCRSLAESKAAVPFLASLRLPAAGSFLDFILACFSSLLVHEMELLLVLLWRFWFRRNHAVHSAPLLSVEDTVGWSERFLVDFQAAVAVPSVRCELVVERWLAPSPGWVKINSDVAVDVRGRRLGFGVVIRDYTGKVLVSYTSLLLGLFSSDIGEALAILLGLRLAIDMGLSTVCVESDAASVVKQLSSRVTSCSDIGLILDDILSLVVNFADLSFSSVRRSANIVAHGLAKFALSHQPVGVRLGSVPSPLALVVLDDSRGYP
ncbi:hypothetical protein ACOSQ2_011203 [Xanthoceras sorbifolium]